MPSSLSDSVVTLSKVVDLSYDSGLSAYQGRF